MVLIGSFLEDQRILELAVAEELLQVLDQWSPLGLNEFLLDHALRHHLEIGCIHDP